MANSSKRFSIRQEFTGNGLGNIADMVISHLQKTVGMTVTRRQVYQAGHPSNKSAHKAEIIAALEYLRDVKIEKDTEARIRKIKGELVEA